MPAFLASPRGKEVILLKLKAYALMAVLGTFAALLANTGWGP
jgi:hypothetical protein